MVVVLYTILNADSIIGSRYKGGN